MRVLTNYNSVYEMAMLPNDVDPSFDLHYCVLDYSDPKDVDFNFWRLYAYERYHRACADLRIGPYRVQMPLDWSVVIADKDTGSMEITELVHLNDREFDVFALNPIRGYAPEFHEITIENLFPDIEWTFPKLKHGHILTVPLHEGENPPCALFVKDVQRLPDQLDIRKIFA